MFIDGFLSKNEFAANGDRINKSNPRTFTQTDHFHEDCQWDTHLSL